ncbi:LysR family transcriptional regulator [soil metagenome]
MDKLWAMQVFVRVVDSGSFSRAAASLDLANATVTSAVRNLENHLGVTLIRRNTRHLHLSSEGAMFLARCREVLDAVEVAEGEVASQVGDMRGDLRVEMPISIGHSLICPALALFARRHPETSLSVTLTNQPHNLIEHGVDVAIRMDRVDDAALVARPIYETRYVICGVPEVVRGLPDDPAALDRLRCIGVLAEGRKHPNPWTLRNGDREVVIAPGGPLHFNSSDAIVAAALDGLGLICVLEVFASRPLASGELVEVYRDWQTGKRTFYAVTTKTLAMPNKVRAFIEFLLEVLDAQQHTSITQPIPIGRRSGR